METLAQRIELIDRHVARCKAALDSEAAASPVSLAIFAELERKLAKLKGVLDGDARTARESLLEAEQAADCMKLAAQADPGLSPPSLEVVTTTHDSLCVLKHEWQS